MRKDLSIQKADGTEHLFAYDSAGRLERDEGTSAYTYDAQGNLSSVTLEDGSAIGYEYDDQGRQIALYYPDGSAVRYTYDSLGRLSSVTGPEGAVTTYGYDALGRMVEAVSESLTTTYAYDSRNNLVSQRTTGATELSLAYAYNQNGRLVREERTEAGGTTVSEYGYDALSRLVAYARSDGYGDLTQQLRQTNELVERAYGNANARIRALEAQGQVLTQKEKDAIFAEECWNVTEGYKDYWNRQDGYFDQASGWEATGVKAHEATVVFSAMERGGLSEEKTSDFGISDLYQAFVIGSMEQGATLIQTLAALAYLHEYGNITYDDFVAIGIYTGLESQRANESEEWAVLMELSYRTSQFGLTLAAANSLYLREHNMQLIAYLALQAGLLAEQLLLGPSGIIYKEGGLDAIEFEGVDKRWQQGDSGGSALFEDYPKFAFEEEVAAGGVGRKNSGSSEYKPSLKPYGSNVRANEQAAKQGYVDAHDFKEAYVPKNEIKHYDMKYDTSTGEIYLENKSGSIQIPTGYFHEP